MAHGPNAQARTQCRQDRGKIPRWWWQEVNARPRLRSWRSCSHRYACTWLQSSPFCRLHRMLAFLFSSWFFLSVILSRESLSWAANYQKIGPMGNISQPQLFHASEVSHLGCVDRLQKRGLLCAQLPAWKLALGGKSHGGGDMPRRSVRRGVLTKVRGVTRQGGGSPCCSIVLPRISTTAADNNNQ